MIYTAIAVIILATFVLKRGWLGPFIWDRSTRSSPPKADLVSPDGRLKRAHVRSRKSARKGDGTDMSIVDKFNRLFSKTSSTPPTTQPQPAAPAIPAVVVDYNDGRVPPGAQDRVRRILACLQEVQVVIGREELPGFNQFDIEQMRELHLPKLVKSYIDIPAAHRSEIFRKTGKSASFILNESLDKMQGKIDDILRNLAQHDIDAFTNNTQFIGQRYADEDNPFR